MRIPVFASLAFAFLLTTTLSGCGQKGPLYLPSEETAQNTGKVESTDK